MNKQSPRLGMPLARVFLSLVAILVVSACASQPPALAPAASALSEARNPTQAAGLVIANTGLASPSPAAIGQPTAAVVPSATVAIPTRTLAPQSTVTSIPQATATQPAAMPNCQSPAALTPAQTEGPYFKAKSPERTTLIETGISGTQLVLTGYVLTRDCKPVAGALLDFWQADANGQYDNTTYKLRGHQFSDAQGRYQLITVIPGLYTGRTEHIHVKVQAPKGPVLTTQLYFPNVAANQQDSIFSPSLLVTLEPNGNPQHASFNFIIQAP